MRLNQIKLHASLVLRMAHFQPSSTILQAHVELPNLLEDSRAPVTHMCAMWLTNLLPAELDVSAISVCKVPSGTTEIAVARRSLPKRRGLPSFHTSKGNGTVWHYFNVTVSGVASGV